MKRLLQQALWLALLLTAPAGLRATVTNSVTGGNGSTYTINTANNPPLTLQRGVTYIFQLSGIVGHPFYIKSIQGAGMGNAFTNGVTGNGSTSGILTFVVPTNAPSTLFYNCSIHTSMTGTLNIINPPTPPPFTILGLSVSNNIRLRHTGTNAFTYTPEFTTNLVSTNWVTLTIQSNVFTGGTNEIFCGRPPGSNVFFRVRAQ